MVHLSIHSSSNIICYLLLWQSGGASRRFRAFCAHLSCSPRTRWTEQLWRTSRRTARILSSLPSSFSECLGVSGSRQTVLIEITQQVRSALKPIRCVYKAQTDPRPLRDSTPHSTLSQSLSVHFTHLSHRHEHVLPIIHTQEKNLHLQWH